MGIQLSDRLSTSVYFYGLVNQMQNQDEPTKRAIRYCQLGDFESAWKEAQSANAQNPDNPDLNYILGFIAANRRQYETAKSFLTKCVKADSNHARALNTRSIVNIELGLFREARKDASDAIHIEPNYKEAHLNLGRAHFLIGHANKAIESLSYAIKLDPKYAHALLSRAQINYEQNVSESAIADLNQLLVLKPNHIEALNLRGIILKNEGQYAEAQADFELALRIKPDFTKALINFGVLLQGLGRLDQSRKILSQAVVADPSNATAHRSLAFVKKYTSRDQHFLDMQKLYHDQTLSKDEMCEINFALAKAYEDLQEYEPAYAHYVEGNSTHKNHLNYKTATDRTTFRKLKAGYSAIKRSSLEAKDLTKQPTPIFVIGMPRSGTTLVEQIIASHPSVKGAGELSFVARYGAGIALGSTMVEKSALLAFRKRYLSEIERISDGKNLVIDKTPQNFRFLGLITSSFPEAKIIHVRRDPAAVCWANYKTFFTSASLSYSFNLKDIVRYFEMYCDLMRFWREQLGEKFYVLDYDQLTCEFESETRKLIDYIGLEWDERCLSPHLNKGNVTTASSVQIRSKVYKNSSKQWKNYEPYLRGQLDRVSLFQDH